MHEAHFSRPHCSLRTLSVLQGQTLRGVKAGAAQRLRGIPATGGPAGDGGPGGLCVMEQLTASAKRFGVQLFGPGFLSDGTVRLLLGAQLHLISRRAVPS